MKRPVHNRSSVPAAESDKGIARANADIGIGDRLALAFLNALVALPTGALLWLSFVGIPQTSDPWPPAQAILWFTGVMALLGLFVNRPFLVDFYALCWRVIMKWLAP